MTTIGARPQVGISSCLLGHSVRYDGSHKRDEIVATELAPLFELLPFCPEVGAGWGVPRPPIHLLPGSGKWRAVRVAAAQDDVSAQLLAYSQRMAGEWPKLCGYVFKSRSPSCGLRDVKVFHGAAGYKREGMGLHAGFMRRAFPDLPCIEETQLTEVEARAKFANKVFARFRA